MKKITALFLLALMIVTVIPVPAQAALPGSLKITFAIKGKGHGVGMSMAGVYGMAKNGYRYGQIINHYYPKITWSTIDDNKQVNVWCPVHKKYEKYKVKDYLYRLAEEPDSWPREGLRATMVAARTYLWYKVQKHGNMPGGQYFVCSLNPANRPNIVKAVNDTANKVLLYGGKAIVAAYSSSSGGYTAAYQDTWPGGSTFPYLVRRSSSYDKYVKSTWYYTKVRTVSQIESAYSSIGRLNNMKVIQRNGYGSWGGRVLKIRLYGTSKTLDVGGYAFARKLGWDSAMYKFSGLKASRITCGLSPRTTTRNKYVTVGGYVYPKHNNREVWVYIYDPNGRKYVRRTLLFGRWSHASRYQYRFLARKTGTYKVRTKFVGDSDHRPSISGYRYLTVN